MSAQTSQMCKDAPGHLRIISILGVLGIGLASFLEHPTAWLLLWIMADFLIYNLYHNHAHVHEPKELYTYIFIYPYYIHI